MTSRPTLVRCPACGAMVLDIEGPTHPYLAAVPGCWQVFTQVQAQEMQTYGYPPSHRLVVDSYAAQHPGPGVDRRDRQSVWFHLAALCVRFEMGLSEASVAWHGQRLTGRFDDFPVLVPPDSPASLTAASMLDTAGVDDYAGRADAWGRAVWASWAHEHPRVRAAIAASIGD